jgi:hypothetical protein
MPLHVSSTCVHRQEVKIVLYSLWYHHTETSEWSKITKITKIQFYNYEYNNIQTTYQMLSLLKVILSQNYFMFQQKSINLHRVFLWGHRYLA